MPGMDGTGPLGRGSLTGRGLGPCGSGSRRLYGRRFFRRGHIGYAEFLPSFNSYRGEFGPAEEKLYLMRQKELLESQLRDINGALKSYEDTGEEG